MQGLHPFPLPVGVRLDEENPHLSQCIKCDTFDGFTCPAVYLSRRIPIAGVAHQCGTARFGADPGTSVLDVNCKAHDLGNLYVVDSSFFPSSSACNPSLTIIANALRVGDHLVERMQ